MRMRVVPSASSCSAKTRVDIVVAVDIVGVAVVFSSVHFRRANVAIHAPPPTAQFRPASAAIPPLGWVGSYSYDFAIGIVPKPESATGSPPDMVESPPQLPLPSVNNASPPPDNGWQ